MSSIPLVPVRAQINDDAGRPVSGAQVRMKLTTTEKYQGLIVPREVIGITDANGMATLNVFPNELGSEGSEYDVHVTYVGTGSTGNCGCGCNGGNSGGASVTFRPIRCHAVVPNSPCNLWDIVNLPPYEQRGAGQVLPAEVAGYAYNAAANADQARDYAQQAESAKSGIDAKVAQAESAKEAAQAAQNAAEGFARDADETAIDVQNLMRTFETSVTQRTETTC
ncbi:MAG: hypothetical protein J5960_04775, partial [Desulfovibrio sp.]|nr:hypothetical protein [Desulfovibrio sp.]